LHCFAEAHSHLAIALGSIAFRFMRTGVAASGFIVALLGPIAIFCPFSASTPVGKALVGWADEGIGFGVMGEILGAEDGPAD